MQSPIQPALEKWTENPHYADWLASILNTEGGKLLMEVLSEMAVATDDFNTLEAIQSESLEKMAMHHCLISGQQMTLTNLRMLSAPVEPVQELPHDGWEGEEIYADTSE